MKETAIIFSRFISQQSVSPQAEGFKAVFRIQVRPSTMFYWYSVPPPGPEDLLHFALRDMTLLQMDTLDLPVIANYSPAVHHPRPVRWSCYNIPTEPDQFADADE